MRPSAIPAWTWLAVATVAIQCTAPELAYSQGRWKSAHAQFVVNPGRFGGLGYAIGAEMGLFGSFRASLQRIDWQGIRHCVVYDAATECNNAPVMWEVGGRLSLGSGEKVAPFIGAGVGLYRRTWFTTRGPSIRYLDTPKRSSSPSLSLIAGMDFVVLQPLLVRVSIVHQEVFSSDLEWIYGERVRFSGLLMGLGLAFW